MCFVGSRDSKVYVVNTKTGSHCWEFATGNDVDSSPVVSPGGSTVFAGSHDKKVCALIATMGLIKSLSIENNLNNRLLKRVAGGFIHRSFSNFSSSFSKEQTLLLTTNFQLETCT